MNVVWLPSWYPNRTSINNGDFIARQAKAVAPFVTSLTVITVVKDDAMAPNKTELEEHREGNFTVYLVYYGPSKWSGVVDKIISLKKYTALHFQLLENIVATKGKPDIIHVHVAMKAGIIARKIRQRYNIPYIVTEHSSIYFKEAKPSVYDAGFYTRKQIKLILQQASLLITVSNELGKAINKHFIQINYKVIPNVVDTQLFSQVNVPSTKVTRLIHISGMGHPKNMDAIMKGLAEWKSRGNDFVMHVYGEGPLHVKELVKHHNLGNEITFHGEVSQVVLSHAIQASDALILYSKYETFGCVIIEANACGKPVIVSDIPVFHELVDDKNGIIAAGDDAIALADALDRFVKRKDDFIAEQIANDTASKYSYPVVGRQIKQAYDEVLQLVFVD